MALSFATSSLSFSGNFVVRTASWTPPHSHACTASHHDREFARARAQLLASARAHIRHSPSDHI